MKKVRLLAVYCLIIFCFCFVLNKQNIYAKTQTIFTTLIQKDNEMYNESLGGSAQKVVLKKKKIVIYGSVNIVTDIDAWEWNTSTEGKHAYKLADKVKYRGYSGLDTYKYSKKQFIRQLGKCADSGLGLSLTLKNGTVIKMSINS